MSRTWTSSSSFFLPDQTLQFPGLFVSLILSYLDETWCAYSLHDSPEHFLIFFENSNYFSRNGHFSTFWTQKNFEHSYRSNASVPPTFFVFIFIVGEWNLVRTFLAWLYRCFYEIFWIFLLFFEKWPLRLCGLWKISSIPNWPSASVPRASFVFFLVLDQ